MLLILHRTAKLTTLNRLIYMRLRGVNSTGICTYISISNMDQYGSPTQSPEDSHETPHQIPLDRT